MRKFSPVKIVLGLFAVLALVGCPSGNVITSTGATVGAATVDAQDNVYDVYLLVQKAHAAAVVQYEATKVAMDPATRAATFRSLNDMANGIDLTRTALQTWKRTSATGVTPAYVLKGILDAAPPFLQLAVRVGIVDQKTADTITALLGAIPRTTRLNRTTFRMEAWA